MNLPEAKSEVKRLLSGVDPAQLPPLLHWIRTAGNNQKFPKCADMMTMMMMRDILKGLTSLNDRKQRSTIRKIHVDISSHAHFHLSTNQNDNVKAYFLDTVHVKPFPLHMRSL